MEKKAREVLKEESLLGGNRGATLESKGALQKKEVSGREQWIHLRDGSNGALKRRKSPEREQVHHLGEDSKGTS